MNTINKTTQINTTNEALQTLGKSFYEYKNAMNENQEKIKDKNDKNTKMLNEMQEEIEKIKDNQEQIKNDKNDKNDKILSKFEQKSLASTWDIHNNTIVDEFNSYMRSGKLMEFKNHSNQEIGGYISFPKLNRYLIERFSYVSPVRKLAATFNIQSGDSFDLLHMNDVNVTNQNINEAYDLENSTNIGFKEYNVKMHALEACVNIPQTMLYKESPLNFEQFVTDKIAYDISKLERKLFVEGLDDKIDSILPDEAQMIDGELNYNSLLEMVSKLPEEFHDENTAWFMTRGMYNKFLQMMDKSGSPLIKVDSHHKYFLNYPIFFVPELEEKDCKLILCNLKHGYTIVEHENMFVLHDQYSKKSLIQNYVRKHMGAKKIRKDAFVGLRLKESEDA